MKIILWALLLCSTLLAQKLEVTVSIEPQAYFIEKIAQDRVKVNVMVQPGFSPATYEPKTSQMKALSSSDVYFYIGVPFENVWLQRFKSANRSLMFVDTAKTIQKRQIDAHSHEDEHDHHHGHDHDAKKEQESLDPHVWLDPVLIKQQAKIMYQTLAKLDEDNASFFKKNYEIFLIELDNLTHELETILAPVKHKAFMVFHPSWGYFAQRFDLKQIAVEVSGKEPKPNQLVELIHEAKENNIKTVFVAPEFSQKSAQVIAKSINGSVFAISPVAKNWDENLRFFAASIVQSYQ
jgi:zinc transport system substrate-binding protein